MAVLVQIGETRGGGDFYEWHFAHEKLCTDWLGFRRKRQATGRLTRLGIAISVCSIRLPATGTVFKMWTVGTFPAASIGRGENSFLRLQNAITSRTVQVIENRWRMFSIIEVNRTQHGA